MTDSKSNDADWDCGHGISHKQCGLCYDQKEPPIVMGLQAYGNTTDPESQRRLNAKLTAVTDALSMNEPCTKKPT